MIEIDGNQLSLEQVRGVARGKEAVRLAAEAVDRVSSLRSKVEAIALGERAVYGINTGFGIFSDRCIAASDTLCLNRNLILSHATGTGEPLPEDVVRAAMLIRANALAKGFSGVRVMLIQTLLEMLNRGVTPVVPSQGSLGSSGDLGPLSFLGLVLTRGEDDPESESGWAFYRGQMLTGKAAMAAAGLERLILGPKEGLALNNGATFSTALAVLAVLDAHNLLDTSDVAVSLSLEAMLGSSDAFDARIHAVRGYPGQVQVAERIRSLTHGSTLVDSAHRVQDAYSLRCAPQVHGAVRDTLGFVRGIVEREINAATDNPLLFEDGIALSGGNFHGEPIGLAMDYLAIAFTELAAISERRIFRLTDANLNADLPPMLVDRPESAGLNSGMMMPQYTAASLVLENRTLATPDSVNSLPTSADQEDHNANSMTAARHTAQVLANTAHVLATECYVAARAVDQRLRQSPDLHLGTGTAAAYHALRAAVAYHADDHWWNPEIETVKRLVLDGVLAAHWDAP
jgi:histidine ammonia-lyase